MSLGSMLIPMEENPETTTGTRKRKSSNTSITKQPTKKNKKDTEESIWVEKKVETPEERKKRRKEERNKKENKERKKQENKEKEKENKRKKKEEKEQREEERRQKLEKEQREEEQRKFDNIKNHTITSIDIAKNISLEIMKNEKSMSSIDNHILRLHSFDQHSHGLSYFNEGIDKEKIKEIIGLVISKPEKYVVYQTMDRKTGKIFIRLALISKIKDYVGFYIGQNKSEIKSDTVCVFFDISNFERGIEYCMLINAYPTYENYKADARNEWNK
jgi:hypothetical protein